MIKTQGYAAQSATFPLKPWEFERREPASHDIHLEILYCGICHSDIHRARNEWLDTRYPIVPGHEIVGRVVEIGDKVTKFKIGDRAAVGAMVGSCLKCDACKAGLEQFCKNGFIETFNTFDKNTGSVTYGGYATNIVVSEQFTLHIPDAFKDQDLPGIAPLLCAGITTYSPLKYWNIGADKKVGIVGIGGLGHVAVKLAHALGANVTAITTTPSKESDATRLGATTSI
ncbi:MAG: NAD(P)-dependent alcohol dehydrogenase, partial [Candidatus Dependentiae bacterium]|nr:NAD(P)-dependent alcohol dehydrogenase [Candidatus Dependentiae bacterium]